MLNNSTKFSKSAKVKSSKVMQFYFKNNATEFLSLPMDTEKRNQRLMLETDKCQGCFFPMI